MFAQKGAARARTLGLCLALGATGCHPQPATATDPVQRARQRLAAAPRDPAVHLELAHLALAQQDYLRAMQYLTLAERGTISAEQREEIFRMALSITVRSRNYEEGIRRTQEELRVQESLPLRRMLALLLEAHGDSREAERQHLVIAELYPTAIEPLAEAARFYERSSLPDRLVRARAFYERYLQAAPQGPESAQVRAALVVNRQTLQQSP